MSLLARLGQEEKCKRGSLRRIGWLIAVACLTVGRNDCSGGDPQLVRTSATPSAVDIRARFVCRAGIACGRDWVGRSTLAAWP